MRLARFLLLFASTAVFGQDRKVDVYSASTLERKESDALKGIRTPGSSQGILDRYPNHFTMFIVRDKDGQSELHENLADFFFVVDGEAELWSGGKIESAQMTAPGEQRGSSLTGNDHVRLRKGDVIHIPAGVPHQLRIRPGSHFAYFVVKVDETKR